VAGWIAETEAEKANYALVMRRSDEPRPRMSEAEIKALVEKFAEIATVLQDADPDDKAEIFRQLGLKLTYHPGRRLVEAEIKAPAHWYSESVRGPTRTLRT
jgi:site-specific DNA recombinase